MVITTTFMANSLQSYIINIQLFLLYHFISSWPGGKWSAARYESMFGDCRFRRHEHTLKQTGTVSSFDALDLLEKFFFSTLHCVCYVTMIYISF